MKRTKFVDRPAWGILQLIFGVLMFVAGTEWYHYLIGFIGLISGGYTLYKYQKIKKQDDNALTILRERYAKGEITQEEFDSMKEHLND